jgi:hypothetical protein
MSNPNLSQSRTRWRRCACSAALTSIALTMASLAHGGEGGVSHVQPGSNATLADMAPTQPGSFFKTMYINYKAEGTRDIPTAAGLAANLSAKANTIALGGGHTFDQTVLGGAHYTVAAFLPYSWIDASGIVRTSSGLGLRQVQNSVSGLGDLTVVPAMLAWKAPESNWQFSALLPIYVPTGSYKDGRLGNPGLNYWTIDLMGSVAYSNAKSGFNAIGNLGYAYNTQNSATEYKSGALLHFDGSIQQILPLGSGLATIGAEAFYFQQVSCDSGAGAVLGCFKGRTAGLGPVLGYIQPLGLQALVLELKWLAEMDVENRLKGDYLWLKAVYKF